MAIYGRYHDGGDIRWGGYVVEHPIWIKPPDAPIQVTFPLDTKKTLQQCFDVLNKAKADGLIDLWYFQTRYGDYRAAVVLNARDEYKKFPDADNTKTDIDLFREAAEYIEKELRKPKPKPVTELTHEECMAEIRQAGYVIRCTAMVSGAPRLAMGKTENAYNAVVMYTHSEDNLSFYRRCVEWLRKNHKQ